MVTSMGDSFFEVDTLDDLMRLVIEAVLQDGRAVVASKGPMRELTGILIHLSNPRARLSRTESRGKPFSCLGELLWYLSGQNSLDPIAYYLPYYKEFEENGLIHGGYGPRLFGEGEKNQIRGVIDLLRRKSASRQGVVQIFRATDLLGKHKDIPCTCVLQFMVRCGKLSTITYMRSNDICLGLPHDIFCFTMLQELVARSLDVDIGTYKHMVGSLHLYDRDSESAEEFLGEGWQSTTKAMAPMPDGDPWQHIDRFLAIESDLRDGGTVDENRELAMGPYWGDLTRLLMIFRCLKQSAIEDIASIRSRMESTVFDTFIDEKTRLGP